MNTCFDRCPDSRGGEDFEASRWLDRQPFLEPPKDDRGTLQFVFVYKLPVKGSSAELNWARSAGHRGLMPCQLHQILFRAAVRLCAIVIVTPTTAAPMFNDASFAQIRFLEGRWKGVGPDGKEFFEEYVLSEPTTLRSIRHADSSFSKATDGSTVSLKDGVIVSSWGQFTWRAVSLSATKACFEPMNAPSAFCWESISPNEVNVTQRWTDAEGREQSFMLTLVRVAG